MKMERYTLEQRLEIVKIHYKYGEKFAETVRKVRTAFGRNCAPSRTAIVKLIRKFQRIGDVADIKNATRVRPARSPESIAAVSQSVYDDPNLSIRHRSQLVGLSPSTIWKILHKDLGFTCKDDVEEVEDWSVGCNYKAGKGECDKNDSAGKSLKKSENSNKESCNDDNNEGSEGEEVGRQPSGTNSQGQVKIKLTSVSGVPKKRGRPSTTISLNKHKGRSKAVSNTIEDLTDAEYIKDNKKKPSKYNEEEIKRDSDGSESKKEHISTLN